MNYPAASEQKPAWTWADQLMTYRFWGLALFYVFAMLSSHLMGSYLVVFLSQLGGSSGSGSFASSIGTLFIVQSTGMTFGFLLGLAAARWNGKGLLLIAGGLQLLGAILLTLPGYAALHPLRWLGMALFGFAIGAVSLGVPALIAGGRGGALAFAACFGMLQVLTSIQTLSNTVVVGGMINSMGLNILIYLVCTPLVIGLLLLVFVDPLLFNGPPVVRRYQWPVVRRDALGVGLLSILSPVFLYYLYKFHGEVASLAPSPRLFSPGGAVWAGLFLLLFAPVMLMTLVEHLNERAAAFGRPPLAAPWAVFVWGIFLPPVAAGLVQSALNRTV